jgi:hypothetical protein
MAVPTTEYIEPGVVEAYFVPTIASTALIPTAAEVTAGTRLSTVNGGLIGAGLEGFSITTQFAKKSILADNIELNVPGMDQIADSTLRFNRIPTSAESAKKTALAKGASGYLLIFGQGIAGTAPAAGDKADVWPGTSGGANDDHGGGGGELARWHAAWGATQRPAKLVTLT